MNYKILSYLIFKTCLKLTKNDGKIASNLHFSQYPCYLLNLFSFYLSSYLFLLFILFLFFNSSIVDVVTATTTVIVINSGGFNNNTHTNVYQTFLNSFCKKN